MLTVVCADYAIMEGPGTKQETWGAILKGAFTSPTDLVSGTKVEAGIVFEATYGTNFRQWQIENIEITVNDVLVHNVSGPIQHYAPTTQYNFRFASTYVADGSQIVIRVKAKFTFGAFTSNPVVHNYDRTFNLVAWNKAQYMGARYDENGQESVTLFGQTKSFKQTSIDLASNAHSHLGPSHSGSPSSAGSVTESVSGFIGKLKDSTVGVFTPHGDLGGIYASEYNPSSPDGNLALTWSQISSGVGQKFSSPVRPKFCLIAMYGCNTMPASGASQSAYAFGISSTNQVYLGFQTSINTYTWSDYPGQGPYDLEYMISNPFDKSIADHAAILFGQLFQGKTASEARALADLEVPLIRIATQSVDGELQVTTESVSLKIEGDPYTRLKYVYLTASERAARAAFQLSNDVWAFGY